MSLILLISQVSSDGMVCSIAMLFTMLCLVFTSILVAGWKMTKCNSHHFLTHLLDFSSKRTKQNATTLVQLWDIFGATLRQFWDNFETTLRHLWDIFGTTLRHLWYNFGTALRHLWNNFGHFETVLAQLLKTWRKPWDNIETIWKKLWDFFEITFGLYGQNMHSSLTFEFCIHLRGLLFQSHLHNSSHKDNNVFPTEP